MKTKIVKISFTLALLSQVSIVIELKNVVKIDNFRKFYAFGILMFNESK